MVAYSNGNKQSSWSGSGYGGFSQNQLASLAPMVHSRDTPRSVAHPGIVDNPAPAGSGAGRTRGIPNSGTSGTMSVTPRAGTVMGRGTGLDPTTPGGRFRGIGSDWASDPNSTSYNIGRRMAGNATPEQIARANAKAKLALGKGAKTPYNPEDFAGVRPRKPAPPVVAAVPVKPAPKKIATPAKAVPAVKARRLVAPIMRDIFTSQGSDSSAGRGSGGNYGSSYGAGGYQGGTYGGAAGASINQGVGGAYKNR